MKKIVLMSAALLVFALTSCDVREGLEPCPTGGVSINIYVERFGGSALVPPARSGYVDPGNEDIFNSRIRTLHYYLYKDDVLVEQGPIEGCDRVTDPHYLFERENLADGNYKLALMANCAEEVMQGNPDDLNSLSIVYPGHETTEDYFITLFPFTVDCAECSAQYTTRLQRLHGVVRYTIGEMPENVRAVEVSMDGLTSTGSILGTYSEDYDYTIRIPVNRFAVPAADASDQTIVGTFPTTDGGLSRFHIALYDQDNQPILERTLYRDDLEVVRNQLLDLTASYRDGDLVIEVEVDARWDGSNEGGEGVID